MFKKGDVVTIRPGVIGAGQKGRVRELWEHSNIYGTVPMFVVDIEDGITAKFTPDLMDIVKKWRSIDDE